MASLSAKVSTEDSPDQGENDDGREIGHTLSGIEIALLADFEAVLAEEGVVDLD